MSKKKLQAWLVYDVGDAYEGGIEPLLVAATRELAFQAKADIKRVIERVRDRLKRMPDPYEDGISDDQWQTRYDAREKMLSRVRWPHGIARDSWSWDFKVGVMALPMAEESRP